MSGPVQTTLDLTLCVEYWRALGSRVDAITALVRRDDDGPYRAWWRKQQPHAPESHLDHRVAVMRRMIAEIRREGYDTERWRTDARGFDGNNGYGPISVHRHAAGYTPWDGAHRACILRALGLPVPAVVL